MPVIAIDGTSGVGKGTLAKALSEKLNFAYLDTGLLYRAVAAKSLADNINAQTAAQSLQFIDLQRDDLRAPHITDAASKVAADVHVRAALKDWQQDFAKNPPNDMRGSILDGRDIGTVICPDADVKLFLTADLAARAARRYNQQPDTSLEKVAEALKERDTRDATRVASPLTPADDAFILDTTDKSIADVLTWAINHVMTRIPDLSGV